MRFRSLLLFSMLALSACGEKPAEKAPASPTTAYGTPQEVNSYMIAVDALVLQLNGVHQELYAQVGSSGKATGANLAPAMEQGRPKLVQILAELDNLKAPALLVPFHQQVRKVAQLRLDAYSQTLEGWTLEQAKAANFASRYSRSEELLAEAQELGLPLGEERNRIQEALVAVQGPAQAATR